MTTDNTVEHPLRTLDEMRARPRKPKEFDFWEAMRAVYEGRACGATNCRTGERTVLYLTAPKRICLHTSRESVCISSAYINDKWTLIGNDGKPVYE